MPNIPSYAEPTQRPVTPQFTPQSAAGASADAFGAETGGALQRMGSAFEQNASRWEAQAQALQTQDNEAAANELTTQYLIKQSALTEEFKQLQGKDPAGAMAKYTKDLDELRSGLRASAGNGEVARLFDRETQRQFGYAVMNGSAYASQQMKSYRNAQQRAVVDNTVRATADAVNFGTFKAGLDSLAEKIRGSEDWKGQAPEVVDAQIRTEQGKAWSTWLKDVAEKDPTLARKILKEHRSGIDGIVAQNLENVINTQTVAKIGDRLVNDSVLGGATDTREQKRDYAMSLLTSALGKAGAAAIIGPADFAESGLNAKAANSIAGGHKGIIQWDSTRWGNLEKWAFDKRLDPNDFKTQVQFAVYELTQGSHKSVGDKLRATDDVNLATRIATGEYEIPEGTNVKTRDVSAVPDLNKRLAGAQALYGRVVSPISTLGSTPGQRQALENSVRRSAEDYADANGLDQSTRDALVKGSIARLDSAYSKQVSAQRDAVAGNRNVLLDFVNGGTDGKNLVTSLDEITGGTAPTNVRDAWYGADPVLRQSIENRIKTNAAAKLSPTIPTPETIATNKRLRGMMVDDPDGFVALDLDKESLTRSDLRTLIQAQDKIRTGRVNADEMATTKRSVDTAVGVMRSNGLLDLSGFRKEDPEIAENMGRLRGALTQELDAFNVAHQGQRPSEKELLEIGRKVIREEVTEPSTFLGVRIPFTGGTERRFIPEKAAPAIVNYDDIPKDKVEQMREFYARTGRPATRQQYRMDYQRWLDRQAGAQ